jgi:hypothetical protein
MLRNQLDESQVALRTERERQEAYIRASEDRAHLEVDRARHDGKQWQQRHEVVERTSRDAMAALQGRHDAAVDQARHLEQEVARQTGQIDASEKALSEACSATSAKRKKVPAASKGTAKRDQRKSPPKARRSSPK